VRIETVFFDVGGTLWPERVPDGRFIAAAAARLTAILGLEHEEAAFLATRLSDATETWTGQTQDTDGSVVEIVNAVGLGDRGLDPALVRGAMCLPARETLQPFPGTYELLAQAQRMGLRVAIVSNTQWRDSVAYEHDFIDLGLADFVDVYVTSLDVGYRKPHEAMFRTALEALNADPTTTVMVGNSITDDIIPAGALGLQTLLVANQDQPPGDYPAQQVCTSLTDVRHWLTKANQPNPAPSPQPAHGSN
jgi:HAD superfamily hydrolase (TIGR01509 family)